MVITLDKYKKPLGFCTERRARILLTKKRACVYRRYPFTIIIKDADVRTVKPTDTYRIKIDPGAAHDGISIVRNRDNAVMICMQLDHRATAIVKRLLDRKGARRNRRNRETRYRRCKYKKGTFDSSRKGKLPPSVQSIVDNTLHWVKKLKKFINITSCSFEAVRFDTQLLDNPDIEGEEYQHGTLYGTEIREYLLSRYRHTCQYCGGESKDPVLEWEHKIPRSRGGSDSVKNATLSCKKCNSKKGALTPEEWLNTIKSKKKKTELDKARINGIQKVIDGKVTGSNRYCAWVTSTRRAIEKELFNIFGDVECSSGGRTKYNRTKLGFPKTHHYDALCVGSVPEDGFKDLTSGHYLHITARGRGGRLLGNKNQCGVITVKYKNRTKRVFGFQNGDIVAVDKPIGEYAGKYTGVVTIRRSGIFAVSYRDEDGEKQKADSVNYSFCTLQQAADGYAYENATVLKLERRVAAPPTTKVTGVHS